MLTQISSEEFRQKYLLGRQVTHEGVRSFEARDTADRNVIVHLLGAVDGPEAVPWLAALSALTPERRSGLLGAFQIDREAVLVTEFLPQVRSLAEWFVATAGDRRVTDQTSAVQDGDVTSVEPTITAAEAKTDSDLGGVADPATEGPAHAKDPIPGQGAGEFTRMFAPDHHDPVSAPPNEVPTEIIPRLDDPADAEPQAAGVGEAPVKQTGEGHGEFTSMFGEPRADAPVLPIEPPEEQKPTVTPGSQDTPGSEPDQQAGEFTVFFGAEEKTDVDPQHSQAPIRQPSQPSPPRQQETPRRPDEKRKAGPRIVWRDQKSKGAPPEPEQPKIKIRLAKDSPPKEPGQAVPPPPPPGPAPSQPPGQFTEIFGHALSQDSRQSPPGSHASARSDGGIGQSTEDELPPARTGPRTSVSQHHVPLSEQTSNNYLRALGSDLPVPPPPAVPAPEPSASRYDHSPDLPPPVTRQRTEPAPGPSDYTQVVSGRPAVPPPQAAPAPSPSPPKESGESVPARMPTWVWVALVAIALIMVLLIALVVLT